MDQNNDISIVKIMASKLLTKDELAQQDWQSLMINKACTIDASNVAAKKIIRESEVELARLLPFEIFILNSLNGDVSDLFKAKLKKQLRDNDFKVERDKSGSYTVLKRLA